MNPYRRSNKPHKPPIRQERRSLRRNSPKGARIIAAAAAIWICTAVMAGAAAAAEKRIVVINSDTRVEKYREVETGFIENVGYPVSPIAMDEVDLTAGRLHRRAGAEADLLFCIGSKAFGWGRKTAAGRPLLFASVLNWLRYPVTQNTYGISNELPAGMEITLFKAIFPAVSRIGVLYSKRYTREWFAKAQAAAEAMGVSLVGKAVSDSVRIMHSLESITGRIDAFWLIPEPVVLPDRVSLLQLLAECDEKQIPVFTYHDLFAKYGATLVVSVDNPTIGRQAAVLAKEILTGAPPAHPVQYPAGSRITINLRKIKEYRIEYNEDMLGSINTVIE